MKYNITILLLFSVLLNHAQRLPALNYESGSQKDKIKSITTLYFKTSDTSRGNGQLFFTREFDQWGKLKQEYVFSFWEILSTDRLTEYFYDANHQLKEKISVQNILDLTGKNDAVICVFKPQNERVKYQYNFINHLIREVHYAFGREGIEDTSKIDHTVEYEYDKSGKLKKKTRYKFNELSFEIWYQYLYQYNKKGQKIYERYFHSEDRNNAKETFFKYNSKGQLIEQKEVNQNTKQTVALKKFNYDASGRWIPNEVNRVYTYYPNGLIRSEYWSESALATPITYITYYEFY